MSAEIVQLYDTNFRDPVAALRSIADEIERGDFGDVSACSVVIMGETLEVFAIGEDSDGATAIAMLQAGALRLIKTIESHGQDT